ncbi:uncharacterized protein FIBRA_03914 [Fibroporia radiculosa]|uniref:Iron-sulfur assembly protein 1 n=1 Tax=Fibroporia radiculosa TaxID=599839 RepID=J4H2N7_9APHY|nr:uncharacterized protein FIBRA_03914 [Fibroporia radiculosa]CCM01844.1 predicted protein [Fibroporia radiculosa]
MTKKHIYSETLLLLSTTSHRLARPAPPPGVLHRRLPMASRIPALQRSVSTLSFASHSGARSCCRSWLYLPSHRLSTVSNLPGASRPRTPQSQPALGQTPPVVVPAESTSVPSPKTLSPDAASPQVAARPPPAPKAERRKPTIKATKAAITLTPTAVDRLRALINGPVPRLIRIGVRNKGCAGLSYHLDYVEQPGKFDEVVEQDGVKVLIDSKALFSIIGSEMDWHEDALSAKFAFKNPNIKDACGCGESFSVGS